MRLSVVIGAHNEGERLWKTVDSVIESAGDLEYELIVVDDASADGSGQKAKALFPQIRLVRNKRREGVSATRAIGAEQARGETLIFLDAHTKPAWGALYKLTEAAEKAGTDAIVTPHLISLDVNTWQANHRRGGYGYAFDLETFDCWWVPLDKMKKVSLAGFTFYESPAAIGCAFAISQRLYQRLHGFDQHMQQWGWKTWISA